MDLKQKIQNFFYNLKTNHNYQLAVMAGMLILGAIIVWLGVWYSVNQKENNITENKNYNENINKKKVEKVEKNIARHIDGIKVAESKANLFPIAIMMENLASENVRPQYGLSKAQVVYEMIVEGGITRFMAVYANNEELEKLGPVRSARPTYLEYVSEYDALYTHAGGSPEAMAAIDGLAIKDCSALGNDSRFFWRDIDREAPHNLFTSSELMNFALRDKNFAELTPSYDKWSFKDEDDSLVNESDAQRYVEIDFSTPEYSVKWQYNEINNVYLRYNGGVEHKDALTDKQIEAKNIIIQIVPSAIFAGEEGRVNFDVNGEGAAYIFRDGIKIEGKWRKNGRTDRTRYYDNENNEINFNRGNIWVEILPMDRTFTYNENA